MGVDADVPVDAQLAPTGTCKTAQNAVSHKRPHPSSVSRKDEQRKDRTLAARRVILISDRGLSLGHFSRAEVGQFWRASKCGPSISQTWLGTCASRSPKTYQSHSFENTVGSQGNVGHSAQSSRAAECRNCRMPAGPDRREPADFFLSSPDASVAANRDRCSDDHNA